MVEIWINNKLCDGYNKKDIDLAISLGVNDAKDINKTFGTVTKSIKLPATPVNKAIFEWVEDINCTGLNQNTSVLGVIYDSGTIVASGFVKMESATTKLFYEFTLRGNNKGLFNAIGEQRLRDIDWSDLNHYYVITNIMNSWNSLGNYVYPLIDYGWIAAWSNSNTRLLRAADFYPAFKIKEILKRVIESAGYTISSAFYLTDYFDRLYMPFVGKFNHTEAWVEDKLFKAEFAADVEVYDDNPDPIYFNPSVEIFDNGNHYDNTTGIFFCGISQVSLIIRLGFVNHTGTSIIYDLLIYRKQTGQPDVLVETITFEDINNIDQYIFESQYHILASNQSLYVRLRRSNIIFIPPPMLLYTLDKDKCSLSNDVLPGYLPNQNIEINDIMFDLGQLDFIQMVKNEFNLHFDTDSLGRVVYFEPENDFYSENDIIDLSKMVDNSVKPEMSFVGEGIEKELYLGYTVDSADNYATLLNKKKLYPTGTHKEAMLNKFGATKGEFTVGFSPTVMEFFGQIKMFTFKLPRLWTAEILPETQSTEFNFRILYNAGLKALQTGETVPISLASSTIYYATSLPYFFFYDETENNNLSLKFEDDTLSFGLVSRHHRIALNRLNYSKFIKLRLNLSSVLVSKFQINQYFKKKYHIESAQYPEISGFYRCVRINDYKPNANITTEVILMTLPDKIVYGKKTGNVFGIETIGVLQQSDQYSGITGQMTRSQHSGQQDSFSFNQGNMLNGGEMYIDNGTEYEPLLITVGNKLVKLTL